MRILLDENFPIQLYRRLQEVGHDAERVDVWLHAIDDFLEHPIPGRLFEVLANRRVVAWRAQDPWGSGSSDQELIFAGHDGDSPGAERSLTARAGQPAPPPGPRWQPTG
ncbi:MAG: hypothetical protein ACYCST_16430 [Acidimicrobiales bacterium]